ncbi:ricin-type beta-trefoil lectin domain protein [Nonomuraea sp. MCN248]|uniref:Ricin-type beta-trefoil lectin domain protein n=1 Tax=Nonomuraea corallina TaxID=2989783 RepID=A0ABT4SM06_9ACTN|nr:ricin-type beta-trefoil lectin domain protein [Nonomuraea corallina]MDA0638212.1 ricin-type beta-trefoil lectin domain protein [Nonomuraea corallina]
MSKNRLTLALSLIATVAATVLAGTAPAASATVQAAPKAATPAFACDATDTKEKGWVLPVYVHQPGQNQFATELESVERTLWETDQTFDASAHRFGGSLRIRYVQDAGCRPIVAQIPFVKGRNRAELGKAFQENLAAQPARVRELAATNRVKLMFFVRDNEITGSCTGGGADAGLSNGGVILPRWCWSEAGFTHEMIHGFGLGHCNVDGTSEGNGDDPVCRNMGSRPECTGDTASNYHLDSCRTDKFRYFEPTKASQPAGEPLAKNRNVAFSPYLITDRPTPAADFRMRVVESRLCLDGSAQEVTQAECSNDGEQTWRRSIDSQGYLTIRNVGTGRCLQLTAKDKEAVPVITAPCVAKQKSQQWIPDADQDRTNFLNRSGGKSGAKLTVQGVKDGAGAKVVRGGGTTMVAEYLGTGGSSPAPTKTAAPVPTTTPTPRPTDSGEPAPTRTSLPVSRNIRLESASGRCLTSSRTSVRLGSCRAANWRMIPVAGQAVQIRSRGRCLTLGTLGPARMGKRSVVLAGCGRTSVRQQWVVEPRQNGIITLKSAATRATRLVGEGHTRVYAMTAYPSRSLTFTIR